VGAVKIPVQEKIAELERRIEALERAPTRRTPTTTTTTGETFTPMQRWHWDQLWRHFDGFFKGLQRRG